VQQRTSCDTVEHGSTVLLPHLGADRATRTRSDRLLLVAAAPFVFLRSVARSILAIEQRIRDDTLFDEKIKLVREAASVCYRQYHVNQEYKCRPIYTEYLRMIQHKNGIIHDHPEFLVRTSDDCTAAAGAGGGEGTWDDAR
jgi:hypothetical protein